jgi:hypothetical protein
MFLVFWLMLWAVIEKSLEDLVLLNPEGLPKTKLLNYLFWWGDSVFKKLIPLCIAYLCVQRYF